MSGYRTLSYGNADLHTPYTLGLQKATIISIISKFKVCSVSRLFYCAMVQSYACRQDSLEGPRHRRLHARRSARHCPTGLLVTARLPARLPACSALRNRSARHCPSARRPACMPTCAHVCSSAESLCPARSSPSARCLLVTVQPVCSLLRACRPTCRAAHPSARLPTRTARHCPHASSLARHRLPACRASKIRRRLSAGLLVTVQPTCRRARLTARLDMPTDLLV